MSEEQNNYQNSPEYRKIRRQIFWEEVKKQIMKSLGFYVMIPILAFLVGIVGKAAYLTLMWGFNLF